MSENVVGLPQKKPREVVEIAGFAPGCRVQLKSGGQEMVVREVKKSTSKDGKELMMIVCDGQIGDGSPVTSDYWPDQLWRIERFDI